MLYQLAPEWAPQDAVLLTWPHAATDWAPQLAATEAVFVALAKAISQRAQLMLVCHNQAVQQQVKQQLQQAGINMALCHFALIANNDSWARDHGPISVYDQQQQLCWLNFEFTGWGDKFSSQLDNQINGKLFGATFIKAKSIESIDLVLEGGAIETDGHGSLMLTRRCLLNANRNPQWQQAALEQRLAELFGISQFLWLDHGQLSGDDTDAHIDTLARFTPNNGIVYVSCDDANDPDYIELQAMAKQLAGFRNSKGQPYRLFALPWPSAKYAADGQRLPASYANYLLLNGAVLAPTYQDAQDQAALAVLAQAYPGMQIIGIDCLPLINQYGSLHCVTMQLPLGVL